jgi:putative acetyltransferase
MEILEDDLTGSEIIRFLEGHLANMHEISPPESVHALGVEALRSPGVTVWSAWNGTTLLGCGALEELDRESGEIKAMRTDPSHRRKGVAAGILEQIIEEARRRGYQRLYLETGSMAEFAAARSLYSRYGFVFRGPFGDYVEDPNSVFMAKELR